jgi:hypothetical protein
MKRARECGGWAALRCALGALAFGCAAAMAQANPANVLPPPPPMDFPGPPPLPRDAERGGWRNLSPAQRDAIRRLSQEERDALAAGSNARPGGPLPPGARLSAQERRQLREQIRQEHERRRRFRLESRP